MEPKKIKKFELNSETVSNLSKEQQSKYWGGTDGNSDYPLCITNISVCPTVTNCAPPTSFVYATCIQYEC